MQKKTLSVLVLTVLFVSVPTVASAASISPTDIINALQEKVASLTSQRAATINSTSTDQSAGFLQYLKDAIKKGVNPSVEINDFQQKLRDLLSRTQSSNDPTNVERDLKNLLNQAPSNTTSSKDGSATGVGDGASVPEQDLHYGMMGDPSVMKLQEFLRSMGFFSGPVNGNFLTLTQDAVRKFQAEHNINATGYFGPLTRDAALRAVGGNGTGDDTGTSNTAGRLYISPEKATLKVGEDISVTVSFQPPCAPGLYCVQMLQQVEATLTSEDTSIATVITTGRDCAPPRECPTHLRAHGVHGVSKGSTGIVARYATSEGVLTARMPVTVGDGATSATEGTLTLEPSSVVVKVGQVVPVKAIFTPARPACLNAVPACEIAERAPYEVDIALLSSDSTVAASTCPPESGRATCIGVNGVRGVKLGSALLIGIYKTGTSSFSATMSVSVRQ